MKKWQWVLVIVNMILMASNLAYINYVAILSDVPSVKRRIELTEKRLDSLIKRDDGTVVEVDEERIAQRAADIAIDEVVDLIPSPEPKPVAQVVEEKIAGVQVKEFFVPIGGGSASGGDWTSLSSAQVTVDGSKYGKIAAVYFEASLHVINGYVSARLVNNSDGVVYHDSEISHDGNTASLKTSKKIGLAGGGKTYQVQLRSSSGEVGVMDQARLRIIVE